MSAGVAGYLDRLFSLGPRPPGVHRVAIRAGVSVLVPLLVLLATDHLEWSLYATFGAFTSLYGRERVDLQRVVAQAGAGLGQTTVVVLGALVAVTDHREWVAVPVAAAVAVVASYVSARQQWHPPGSLFQVFGFAAVASVPAGAEAIAPALLVAGGTAAFAIAVGNLGAVVRRVRRVATEPRPGPPIGGVSMGIWRYAVESGAGVLLAGLIATGSGIGRPYWAMVAAVVPLVARDFTAQLTRGLHRIVGTMGGLVLAWILLELDPVPLLVVLVAAGLQVLIELVVGRNYALALIGITPLALLMVHLVAPVPVRDLLIDRGVETVIGVVAGLLVGILTRPRHAAA